ncbi:DNA ligase 1-like [Maniola hyperantus]|uniref:DNA ligase 1-like n=1 Tax=Aphantopus hyperantus TaxID=2795564 RepID=UPI0037483ADD
MFLDGVNRLTVLRFAEIPKPPEEDETRWVLFLNRKGLLGCADHPFKYFTNEGVQKVVLGYDCMNSDENLADVVLSLVGVPPQHNAPDRDKYVDIMKESIIPDKLHLFNKLKDCEWLFHNLTYDFESAGHYGPFKYTSNGKVTVQRKPRDYYLFHSLDSPAPKNKEKGFSSQDILKIAMLYNYILRNRETPVAECSKLFTPGSKPVLLQPNKNLEIKPRKMPSRYLGESEKEQVSYEEENSIEEMNNDNNDDKVMTDDNESKDSENKENEKYLNSSEKLNDDIKNEYSNEDNNNPEDDNNEEIDYSLNINEENEKKLSSNNELENDDEDGDKDYNIDKNKENEDKLNACESEDTYIELNNRFTDSNKKVCNHVDSKNKEKDAEKEKSSEISDREGKKSKKNNVVTENFTTYDGIVNITRIFDRKPLKHKMFNPKKLKLLGQSDYETGDEGKDRYIHENFF